MKNIIKKALLFFSSPESKTEKALYRARLKKDQGVTKESLDEETIRIAGEILLNLNNKGYNVGHIYAALGMAQKMVGICQYLCPGNILEICSKASKKQKET